MLQENTSSASRTRKQKQSTVSAKDDSNRLSVMDLAGIGAEDRIAVLKMVREGECSIDQAVSKVKAEVAFKAKAAGKGLGMERRGAVNVRKFRGRVKLAIRLEKSGRSVVLVVDLEDCRDLMPSKKAGGLDPYLRLFLQLDGAKKETGVQKTSIHKDTRNPIFNEGYSWEIKPETDYSRTRIHIQAYDSLGRLRKAQYLGGMSFSIKELQAESKERLNGWFRLLDGKRAPHSNLRYELKAKAVKPAESLQPPAPAPEPENEPTSPKSAARATSLGSNDGGPAIAPEKEMDLHAAVVEQVPQPLTMGLNDFNYLKVLGQGSFGKVMLAEHNKTSDVYAVKILGKKEVLEDDDVESTMTERKVLALAGGCKFLTKMYATFQTPERLYYVMEFLNGGDLMFHIQSQGKFSMDVVQFYTAEICIGLGYLHDRGIIYRDLKLDNVMLSRDGHIKIADFGMCKGDMFGGARTTTFCGTPGYLAPEILEERPYAKSVDFWSLGVMVYEMMIGESPFDNDDDDTLFEMILSAPIHYPDNLATDALSFLKGLLTRDENKRLGCTKDGLSGIQKHPFFEKLEWQKLDEGQLEPPFKPDVGEGKEAKNFDSEFTNTSANLDPVDPSIVAQFNQDAFDGFDFVNPETYSELLGMDKTDKSQIEFVESQKDKWYKAAVKRKIIAEKLKGKEKGTFYIRDSTSHENSYALTVCVGAQKPWNGLISTIVQADGTTKYRLFQETRFDSISHLIQYYRERPIMRTTKEEPIMLLLPEMN